MKKRINISLDDKTLYIVDHMAESRGIDRSAMITLLIRMYDNNDFNGYAFDYDNGLD